MRKINNRGQSTIAVAVMMSGALLSSAVVLNKVQAINAKKSAAAGAVSIHGHYMNELMAWHAYQMDVVGAPLSGPPGSGPGRYLAEIRPNTKIPLEGLPPNNILPADTYNSAAYVDGTPVNIKATSGLDSAQVLMQPKVLGGLEVWDDTVAAYEKHCSSAAVSDTSATKSCLSQQVVPPTVDLKANGLDGPVSVINGDTVSLDWSSSHADTCAFTPSIGSTATSGTSVTPALTSSVTYSVTCTGLGGTATDSVVLNVSAPPSVTARLLLSPISGGSWSSRLRIGTITPVRFGWSSRNAASCTVSIFSNGVTQTLMAGPASGSGISGDILYDSVLTLTCVNGASSATDTANVIITARWYAARYQDCRSFCFARGKVNRRSPDAATGGPIPGGMVSRGSWCTSGELIPPSAAKAKDNGILSYTDGCYWSCGTPGNWAGANVHLGASVGTRCYGQIWGGGWQLHDNDSSDYTMGCYCAD